MDNHESFQFGGSTPQISDCDDHCGLGNCGRRLRCSISCQPVPYRRRSGSAIVH
jgi:hypothetical protein